jgi:hypothetical protein
MGSRRALRPRSLTPPLDSIKDSQGRGWNEVLFPLGRSPPSLYENEDVGHCSGAC